MFYGFAPIIGQFFNLDPECENDVYNIEVKCLKKTNNNTYMCHCCLGHIGKKCMQKLHKYGVLTSFDFEPFGTCESFLMGKLTETPFTGHP